MDLLNRSQAQDRITKIDEARIPFSVTNGMVASVLNYLLNLSHSQGVTQSDLSAALDLLREEFDALTGSIGYPSGLAILDNQGWVPREMLPRSIYLFDGFRKAGTINPAGQFWAPKGSKIYFDASLSKFFLDTGSILFPQQYISWGSNSDADLPGSKELGPHRSSLYIHNSDLYIWTGVKMLKVGSFSGSGSYDDTDIYNQLQQLADAISGESSSGDVIIDTGPYDSSRVYRSGYFETATRRITEDCWHNGCRWRCRIDGTSATVPGYGSAAWGFISGDPSFRIDFEETALCYTEDEIHKFGATLTLVASLYNQDVLPFIRPTDVSWRRVTYDQNGQERTVSDAAWIPRTDRDNKRLLLDFSDLDYDGTTLTKIIFICTASIDDDIAVVTMEFD